MQKLTKLEIIEATTGHFNLGNRATNEYSGCGYCTKDNKKCAVGRYMGPENIPGMYSGGVSNLASELQDLCLEDVLIPEARGHNPLFWLDLQSLHDIKSNWTEDGLSPAGEREVAIIKEKWSGVLE